MTLRSRIICLYIAILTLLLLILITPAAVYPAGYFSGLDGTVWVIDHQDFWNSLDPISKYIYQTGDLLCHQQYERSLIIHGSQLPICIREFSILTGIILGLVLIQLGSRSTDNNIKRFFAIGLIAFSISFVEWLVKIMINYEDSNEMVFAVSIISGIGFALMLNCIIEYVIERTQN